MCVCRLHERTHSVWPQLWKDRGEYTNPLYKAEQSQSQGVLRPNTSPYCFKMWKGLYNHAEKSTPPRQSPADFMSAVREESQQLEEELTNHQERIAELTGKPITWEKIEVPRRRTSCLPQRHSGPDPPTLYREPIASLAQDSSHTISSAPANQKTHTKEPALSLPLGPHAQLKSHDPDDLSTCSDLESGVADLSSRSSSGGDVGKDPDLE
ncbi:myotubularin-related protein 7-like [Haplochromis burtoni]|uniref:myotubularin-related protein 7-like n=1 Tax=Haplochromis burtoni TaxID=8153 RepID=UPI001C2DC987|nr:myotubularin-related protein 7-like [Haplochromis burtoni]